MTVSKIIKYVAIFVFIALGGAVFCGNLLPKRITGGLTSSAQTLSGAELFKASCARCHGDDGKGGKKQAKWKDSDEKLVKKINGGGFGMPKFRDKLKPEEVQAIADYVRSL
jgi:mono/diheme cytochrome c family protein